MPSLKKNPDGSPHIHSYIRTFRKSDGEISNRYRCVHPDCSHYDIKQNLIGKRSLCPVCHITSFILTSKHLTMARPHCSMCGKSGLKERQRIAQAQAIIDAELDILFSGPGPTAPAAIQQKIEKEKNS